MSRGPREMHGGPMGDAAMSFAEIGRELGISTEAACIYYHRAVRKLKLKSAAMKRLKKIAEAKEVMRNG